jgi:hypothetical protein
MGSSKSPKAGVGPDDAIIPTVSEPNGVGLFQLRYSVMVRAMAWADLPKDDPEVLVIRDSAAGAMSGRAAPYLVERCHMSHS